MTSGSFNTVLIESITIDRPNRQRRELRKVEELAASIAESGLINPPVVTPDLVLVAGERRLEACRSLGWSTIPVQLTTDLDPVALHLIELEENVRREDLTWQEHNDAVVAYHKLRASADPDWTQGDTAKALNLSQGAVSDHMNVAKVREAKPEITANASSLREAMTATKRRVEREKNTVLRDILPELDTPPRPIDLHHTSFLEWEPDHPFNFIHCDFPYGINTGDKKGQSASKTTGGYADTEDVYFALIDRLNTLAPRLCADNTFLMFWFSMKFYDQTKAKLQAGGWNVQSHPLIWHKSDNSGIVSDVKRRPRYTYETAFIASRGDPRIVSPIAASFAAATTKEFHQAEKPRLVLEHFFRLFVDDTTLMLDPTAGSAMAIKVAESMGAKYAVGLEKEKEFYDRARDNLGL